MGIAGFLTNLRTGDYQNDNFKKFLKDVKFSFNLPAIHIAGTNGKGSTANYLASIYKNAGLKVGLYTSPYLFEANEMIKINGASILDSEFESIYKKYEKQIRKYDLSEFELTTFACFEYFKESKCDICIIECGMGGEFDATNIFTPMLSIITSISIEHTTYLGRSISEIAYHKAGIIKKNMPVLAGNLNEEAMNVINEVAKQMDSKVVTVVEPSNVEINNEGSRFDYLTYRDLKIKSKALYSVYDARMAVEAVDYLKDFKEVTNEQIQAGLIEVDMECRMEFVHNNPTIVIDGGHNPEGIQKLKTSLQSLPEIKSVFVIFACFKDKNMQSMLAELGTFADGVVLTTFDHPRARTYEDYFLFAEDYKFEEDVETAIKNAIVEHPNDLILITGSLAFAAYVKGLFKNGRFQ